MDTSQARLPHGYDYTNFINSGRVISKSKLYDILESMGVARYYDEIIKNFQQVDYPRVLLDIISLMSGSYASTYGGDSPLRRAFLGALGYSLPKSLGNIHLNTYRKHQVEEEQKTAQNLNALNNNDYGRTMGNSHIKLRDVDERSRFPGFDLKPDRDHVLLIGPTNSGKTTQVKNQLYKNLYKNYDEFVYCGAMNSEEVKKLVQTIQFDMILNRDQIGGQQELKRKRPFIWFKHQNYLDAFNYCLKNSPSESRKLFFFDDVMAIIQDSKALNNFYSFILSAKNCKTQLIATIHDPTTKNFGNLRGHFDFFVLCNIANRKLFNLYLNGISSPKELDTLFTTYTSLGEHKTFVYQRSTSKVYFGFGDYLSAIPDQPSTKDFSLKRKIDDNLKDETKENNDQPPSKIH